eukprot:3658310-Rhodomonas_salina.1
MQVQNITITHEHIGTRWDDAGGSAIDREIASDDGPVQLKVACCCHAVFCHHFFACEQLSTAIPAQSDHER